LTSLTASDFRAWRTCSTVIYSSELLTGGSICLRYAPHAAIPCLEGYQEVTEYEYDVKPSTSGVSPGSGNLSPGTMMLASL